MASTTPNIGLTLPTGTEGWKRSVINGNFTILDTKIGAVGNTPLQTQINTLSSNFVSKVGSTKITKMVQNANRFEIPIQTGNSFRSGIVVFSDNIHPSMWLIGIGVGASPAQSAISFQKVVGDTNARVITSISVVNDVLTINADDTVYGGIRVIWLD